jgi:hypothetical protein
VEILVTDPLQDLVLQGRTVTLRPLTIDDAGALAMAASESREQYDFTRVPDGVEDARRYIECIASP